MIVKLVLYFDFNYYTNHHLFVIPGSIQVTRVRGLSQAVPFPERPDVSLRHCPHEHSAFSVSELR